MKRILLCIVMLVLLLSGCIRYYEPSGDERPTFPDLTGSIEMPTEPPISPTEETTAQTEILTQTAQATTATPTQTALSPADDGEGIPNEVESGHTKRY